MNSRFVYAIISIVLSALIAFIAIPALNAKTSGKAEVVRVTQPIIKGMPITADTIEVVEVGGYNLPDNIAATMEDVVGKYATADLQPGDFILSSKVSFLPLTSDIQLNNIPSGKVAISITVQSLAAGLSDKLLALVVLDDQIAGRIADLPGESGGFHFLAGVEELAADLVTFTICLALRLRFVSYGCPCRVNRCRFTSRL